MSKIDDRIKIDSKNSIIRIVRNGYIGFSSLKKYVNNFDVNSGKI